MKLDISPQNHLRPDFSIIFQGRVGVRRLKFSNLLTGYSSHPIELKHGRIIIDVKSHNRLEPDFSDFLMGARLLKSSNRFTAYSFYPIDPKLGRMILDISSHNRSRPHFSISSRSLEPDFSFSPRAQCGIASFAVFKSIHSLQFVPD